MCTTDVNGDGYGDSGVRVGYGDQVGTGGVYRVGNTGSPSTVESGGLTAKRAPEDLQGPEWVVRLQRAPELPRPPLPAVGPASLSRDLSPGIPASGPIKARFHQ